MSVVAEPVAVCLCLSCCLNLNRCLCLHRYLRLNRCLCLHRCLHLNRCLRLNRFRWRNQATDESEKSGGRVFHAPLVKSGNSTGRLLSATDASESGATTLLVTES